MPGALERFARLLSRWRVAALLALGLTWAAFGWGAWHLGVDPGNAALFLQGDPARAADEVLERHFHPGELFVVAFEGPLFTEDGLARLDDLTAAIEATGGIERAVSITNAKNVYPGPTGVLSWAPYDWYLDGTRTLPSGKDVPFDLPDLRREIQGEPLFRGNLVSPDGRVAAILVTARDRRPVLVETLRQVMAAHTQAGFRAHLAGFPVERYDFARLIRDDQRLFVPLIVLVIALVSSLLFRQVWGVVLPLLVVGISVSGTLALAWACSVSLNAVTSLLTPVVMVCSVAVGVNLVSAYTRARGAGVAAGVEAAAAAVREVGTACLFTTLTTAVGFGALALSPVPAIREFGFLSAFGVSLSYLVALWVLPPLFALSFAWGPRRLHARTGWIEARLAALGPVIARRRRTVLLGALLVLVGGVWGIARLRVDTDILAQLPPRSPLAEATRVIDRALAGVNAIEVLVEGEPGALRRPASLRALGALEAEVSRWPDVRKTLSVIDLIARLEQVQRGTRTLPARNDQITYALGVLEQGGDGSPLRMLLSKDGSAARLTVRVGALPSTRVYELLERLREEARRLLPADVRAQPTGPYVLIQNMTHVLPRSQAKALCVAAAAIVTAMALLFGSLRLALLAAIPASLPIVLVYGLMGAFSVSLSTATSMIASVVLGLAVDATILLTTRYRTERRAGARPEAAIARTLESVGQSVTFSNIALVCGFLAGGLSSFPPVQTFSLLSAAAIAGSYLGATLLLPALLTRPDQAR